MANNSASTAPEAAKLVERVQELLQSGKGQEAIKLLARDDSPWARNARGVCLLRLGDAHAAVETLRSLVVSGHLGLKPDALLAYKINFATALLMSGNINGGLTILGDIRDEQSVAVQKLRAAIVHWKASMTFWQRLWWHLGAESGQPFTVDFPPGEL